MNSLLSPLVLLLGFSSLALGAVDDAPKRSKPEADAKAKAKAAADDDDEAPTKGPAKKKVTVADEDDDEATTEGPAKKQAKEPRPPAVRSIDPESLVNFAFYPPPVQQLVREALALTKLNLPYTFGGTSPKDGGMDCSGTIYHLLNKVGLKAVPRQSDEMCAWVQGNTLLHRTPTAESLTHPEFAGLQPGDLIFWSGTYETGPRKIPVTHVMLYLGKLKKGEHVTFGSSDGRYFQGERMNGVSVFDFSVPPSEGKSHLYGYGMIPGVGRIIPEPPAPPPLQVAAVKPKPEMPPAEKPMGKDEEETILPAVPVTPPTAPNPVKQEVVKKSVAPKASANAPAKKSVAAKSESDAPVKKRAPVKRPPPEPTPQEQLSMAARKVVSSLKGVFAR